MAATTVQSGVTSWTSGTSDTVVLNSIVAGNAIAGIVILNQQGQTLTSVMDGDQTYSQQLLLDAAGGSVWAFWGHKASGGNKTLTFTFSSGGYVLFAWEVTGHDASAVVAAGEYVGNYQTGVGVGTDNITSTAKTPGRNGACFLAATADSNMSGGAATAGTGFTVSQTDGIWTSISESLAQATAASQAALFNCTAVGSGLFLTGLVIVQPAGGAVGPGDLAVALGEPTVGSASF